MFKLRRTFKVTHPFHPLYRQEFELIGYRRSFGGAFVDYRKKGDEIGSIALEWTDAEEADPFKELSAGRAYFRVAELVRLEVLIAGLKGDVK